MSEQSFEHTRAPLIAHLIELKRRLMIAVAAFLVATAISYFFAQEIYQFLVRPLTELYGHQQGRRLIYTNLTEAFFTYMKLAIFGGLVVSFPVIAWQAYAFIAPGLYRTEKGVVLPYLIVSPLLFVCGAALAYYFVFPLAWEFFLSFETLGGADAMPIQLEAKVSDYLSLVIHFILGFGFAFQLPVLLTLLVRADLVQTTTLAARRRMAVIIIFVVAGVLTPPDIVSQISLAVPLILLYELSIIACRHIEKKRENYARYPIHPAKP